jgi:Na+/melibiose symporter-like transporter
MKSLSNNSNKIHEYVPNLKNISLYSFGSFGTGVFSTVPAVLLLYFCTEILKISPAIAALIVFTPKAWSIIWDPMVGAFSDRANTKFGKRRPFLVAGLIGLFIAFIMLFSPPQFSGSSLALWVGVSYFLLATLYSLYAVPYTAIPAEICRDAVARAKLIGGRMSMAMIGILAGAALSPLLVEVFGGGQKGYSSMSWVIAALCAITMAMPILMISPYDKERKAIKSEPFKFMSLFAGLKSKRLRPLLGSFMLQLSAVGIISSSTPYLVTKTLHRAEGDVSLALFAMLLATTITMPLWAWLGRKFGERRVIILAAIFYCFTSLFLGWVCLVYNDWNIALIAFTLAGIPFAGLQVTPYTYAAHIIHAECGANNPATATYTGSWTAAEKLGLALGPTFTGMALSISGTFGFSLPHFIMACPAILLLISLSLLQADKIVKDGK